MVFIHKTKGEVEKYLVSGVRIQKAGELFGLMLRIKSPRKRSTMELLYYVDFIRNYLKKRRVG